MDSSAMERPFLMAIGAVVAKVGTGMLVKGVVERGVIHVGDELEIVGSPVSGKTTCLGLQDSKSSFEEAYPGNLVQVLLSDVAHYEVGPGKILAKPGTCTAHAKFDASLYTLLEREGGRRSAFSSGYQALFYFRGIAVTGTLELPSGVEIQPGDTIENVGVSLLSPLIMDVGLSFSVKEASRLVAAGAVTATR